MLEITIPGAELWDETNEIFVTTKPTVLRLEHSLVSISKWESKWRIPFMSKDRKTPEQSVDYVRCMTLTQNIDPNVYNAITPTIMDRINSYIETERTATWFNDTTRNQSKKIITSELVYFWMVNYNIPFECQKWHLSRLLTLIKICNIESSEQKMSRNDIYRRNRALNAARRKAAKSRG